MNYRGGQSDSGGYYTIEGLGTGSYYVAANGYTYVDVYYKKDFLEEFYNESQDEAGANLVSVLAGSETPGIDFTLEKGATISGTVYRSDGITAVTGMYMGVRAYSTDPCQPENQAGYGIVDQSNGTYTISGLTTGTYYLRTIALVGENIGDYVHEWWADSQSVVPCGDAQAISVTQGDIVTGKNFQLDVGGYVDGTVTNEQGFPISNVRVVAQQDACTGQEFKSTFTQSDGKYYLQGLPAGQIYIKAGSSLPGMSIYVNEWYDDTIYCDEATPISVGVNQFVKGIDFVLSPVVLDVDTMEVTAVTDKSAECGGNVISVGGDPVTARGVCWSAFSNPTINDSHTWDGTGVGPFTSTIAGLNAETQYYVRAYATNSAGTVYGDEVLFTTVAAIPLPSPGGIPDTGQTTCYDNSVDIPCPQPGESFYGQDGSYIINPPSYTKLDANGNDLPDTAESWVMVRDNVTGLIWEVKQNKDNAADYGNPHDADNTYTWYNSNLFENGGEPGMPGTGTDTEDFLDALNAATFGGYSDWRLPSIKELGSILNLENQYPAIDTAYFPNTNDIDGSQYWSSTSFFANPNYAWYLYFWYGHGSYGGKSGSGYVRAVRGGQATDSEPLIDNGDGTVTDITSGLMWQKNGAESKMTWEESVSYCEALSFAGYNDWRLPNRKELHSIVNYNLYEPAVDTAFFPDTLWGGQPDYDYEFYWSSTTDVSFTRCACYMNFDYGIGPYYGIVKDSSGGGSVRAVRGGQNRIPGRLIILAPAQSSIWASTDVMPITWYTQGSPETFESPSPVKEEN